MTDYRRAYIPGATWFFMVNLAERKGNRLLTDKIASLRSAFAYTQGRRPSCLTIYIAFGPCLPAMPIFPPAGICAKGISPALSPKASASRAAAKNGASVAYGNDGFGNTLSGTKPTLIAISMMCIGIR
jgi:putative transposase